MDATMDYADHCAEIIHQADLLSTGLDEGTRLTASVPSCPDWNLAQLLRHLGEAHRWVEELVRTRATEPPPDTALRVLPRDTTEPPAALAAWLTEGARLLADTLRAAGPEARVWTPLPSGSPRFFARRMAHETVRTSCSSSTAAPPATVRSTRSPATPSCWNSGCHGCCSGEALLTLHLSSRPRGASTMTDAPARGTVPGDHMPSPHLPGPDRPDPPGPVPTSVEEALEMAHAAYAPDWPDGTPAPLRVREFDIGYLVHAKLPPHPKTTPAGERQRPRSPGGTCVVVAKNNGEICRVPLRPPSDTIALFRKFYRPDTLESCTEEQ
ncbi:maleylpyruvate isomerase N-terminal domain-containing protein [Streptomyces nigrescens]